MTAHAPFPALALPVDAAFLDGLLARPGALATAAPTAIPFLARAVAALSLGPLLDRAAAARGEDAIRLYTLWLDANPASPEACGVWFNLGVLLGAAKRTEEAEAAYRRALALRPDLAQARVNLGLALEAQGRPAEALAAWRAGLPPAELRTILHTHLGRLSEEQGLLPEALAEMRAALLIDPDQPDLQQHLLHLRQRHGGPG